MSAEGNEPAGIGSGIMKIKHFGRNKRHAIADVLTYFAEVWETCSPLVDTSMCVISRLRASKAEVPTFDADDRRAIATLLHEVVGVFDDDRQ